MCTDRAGRQKEEEREAEGDLYGFSNGQKGASGPRLHETITNLECRKNAGRYIEFHCQIFNIFITEQNLSVFLHGGILTYSLVEPICLMNIEI